MKLTIKALYILLLFMHCVHHIPHVSTWTASSPLCIVRPGAARRSFPLGEPVVKPSPAQRWLQPGGQRGSAGLGTEGSPSGLGVGLMRTGKPHGDW